MSLSPTTTYPLVAARLTELVGLALPGVPVRRGVRADLTEKEVVAIGNVDKGVSRIPVSNAGRKKRQEGYFLLVNVEARRPGRGPEAAEERAIELMNEVEDVLANNPGLGIADGNGPAQTMTAQIGEWELSSWYDAATSGWACMIVLKIQVDARLG